MNNYSGQCGCSALKYNITAEPLNTAFCYCKECQIHTGSDKWFGVWIAKDSFELTEGTPSIFTRKGDSGEDMHHLFCSECGVTVAVEVTVAGFYSVAATTLDGNPDITPAMAIYTASAPKWAVFPDGIPKFDILPPDMGG